MQYFFTNYAFLFTFYAKKQNIIQKTIMMLLFLGIFTIFASVLQMTQNYKN